MILKKRKFRMLIVDNFEKFEKLLKISINF